MSSPTLSSFLKANFSHLPLPIPLHQGKPNAKLRKLKRRLFTAQAHMASGYALTLERDGGVIQTADCGAGKTSVAIGTVAIHASAPYRAVVMCPGHVASTWLQELDEVLGVKATEITGWRHALSLDWSPGWYVIGRDRAKLGPGRRKSAWKVGLRELCPQCGAKATGEEWCQCGEPLWCYTPKPRRWPIASLLAEKEIDYFIGDEIHECGSASSAQGVAAGRLMAAAQYSILLTATPTGGKAEDLRPTLFRMFPHEMVRRGYSWGDKKKFSQRYGRLEVDKRGKRRKTTVVPGIMPTFYADFLLPHAGFLRLEDISDNLPAYDEQVITIPMGRALSKAYRQLQDELGAELKGLLATGKTQLLGPMLAALMCYPDSPSGWGKICYRLDGQRIPVAKPEEVPGDTAKELALLEMVKAERLEGRQCWVYIQNKRVGDRLAQLFQKHGLRSQMLRAKDAKPRERKAWIARNAPGLDVIVSHARLVQTGIDLFDKKGWTFNFPTLIFHQCGLVPNELRQAAGRARRIGQVLDCRTRYMCYAGTIQERLMKLMASKIAAAEVLEGKQFLSGLAGTDGDIMQELALSIARSIK